MIKALLMACAVGLLSPAASAQTVVSVQIGGVTVAEAWCGYDAAGMPIVLIFGIVATGWTWSEGDYDADTIADDLRITAPDGGRADLENGAANSGAVNGNVRDGNVPPPNNVIPGVTWMR
jgi:hypothetical protein